MCGTHHLLCFNLVDAIEVLDDSVSCADVRCQFEGFKIHQRFCEDEVHVFLRIQVFLFRPWLNVQVKIWTVILIVVILRDAIIQSSLLVQANSGLIRPAPRHVLNRVTTSSEH